MHLYLEFIGDVWAQFVHVLLNIASCFGQFFLYRTLNYECECALGSSGNIWFDWSCWQWNIRTGIQGESKDNALLWWPFIWNHWGH